jgi:hypothetical protein
MPNPPLVFGGAAGIWFGMTMFLDDFLSMPDFGVVADTRPITSPTSQGVTYQDMLRRSEGLFDGGTNAAVYTGNPDIGRFLAVMDIFYTEYGSKLRALGLTTEQIPPNDTMMARILNSEGAYSMNADGTIFVNPRSDWGGGDISHAVLNGIRFPGFGANSLVNSVQSEAVAYAGAVWGAQDAHTEVHPLPAGLTPTDPESVTLSNNEARFNDFINQMIASFIMGTEPLNESTWTDFTNQLRAFGYDENREIWQAAYDRFMARG